MHRSGTRTCADNRKGGRDETYHGYLGQETALDEGRDGQKLANSGRLVNKTP